MNLDSDYHDRRPAPRRFASRPSFIRVAPSFVLLSILAVSLFQTGCQIAWTITDPEREPGLRLEVDSLVMEAFITPTRLRINAADLALFDKHLTKSLNDRERFRTYAFPPTFLPNTVKVGGLLHRFEVTDRQGEGVFLRTVDLDAQVTVMPLEGEEPLIVVRRRVVYQKAYAGPDGVSALPLDLENAIMEWAAQVVDVLDPEPVAEPIVLNSAQDETTGQSFAHPALIKGNRYASAGLFKQAGMSWQRVLFDPVRNEDETREYRISERTLNQLRRLEFQEALLEKLAPLTEESEMEMVPFRRLLRDRLGGHFDREGLVLTLADHQAAAIHLNLAAAHLNLSLLYRMQKRKDLAVYHLARAYAHNPNAQWLERWNGMQEERKVIPNGMEPRDLIDLWLRLPAPANVTVRPGRFELTVAPNPAFAEIGAGTGAPRTQPPRQGTEPGASPSGIPQPVLRPLPSEEALGEETSSDETSGEEGSVSIEREASSSVPVDQVIDDQITDEQITDEQITDEQITDEQSGAPSGNPSDSVIDTSASPPRPAAGAQ